ncbi:MAG: acetyl-CoA acetyltransferase [Pseudonocardia sp. SCN 72-86]|nr:MAG: acetyl-CoA acetyltransferase [Pseudonocardia sp. SCN 72-86]
MSISTRYAITGAAEIPPRRTTPGQSTLGLIGRVAAMAVDDAGLCPEDVDGLLVGPQVGETPQHVPATVAEYLGLRPRYGDVVDLGGASGPGMVWRAAAAIHAGMCETVLCVLANSRDAANVPRASNRNPIREFEVPYGASGANQAYAMAATRHIAEFGTTPEQLASIPVFERRNAALNPDAVFHDKPITIDDVLGSPLVAWPLRMLEVVMPCGGGAAVVVQKRGCRGSRRPPVLVLGAGEKLTHRALSQAPSITTTPLAAAIRSAYDMARVGPSDLDVLSLYDCYSIMLALTLEDAGLCRKGEVGPWLADQDFSSSGNLPLNTHGGQLACGQADLAGGMCHLVEAVRQLRGEAGPRQVANAEVALVTGNGATMGEEVALVLGASP